MKKTIATLKSNPLGAIAGGVVAFYGAKKFAKVSNTKVLIGIALLGVVGGAMAQSKIKASQSKPTAATTKK